MKFNLSNQTKQPKKNHNTGLSILEGLESGFCRETCHDLISPVFEPTQLVLEMDTVDGDYKLFFADHESEFLLFAKKGKDRFDYFAYPSEHPFFAKSKPVFTLFHTNDTQSWILEQECETYLLFVVHLEISFFVVSSL